MDAILNYFGGRRQSSDDASKDLADSDDHIGILLVLICVSEIRGGVKWWNKVASGHLRAYRCFNGERIMLPANTTCLKVGENFYIYYRYDEARMKLLKETNRRGFGIEIRLTVDYATRALDEYSVIFGPDEGRKFTFADMPQKTLDALVESTKKDVIRAIMSLEDGVKRETGSGHDEQDASPMLIDNIRRLVTDLRSEKVGPRRNNAVGRLISPPFLEDDLQRSRDLPPFIDDHIFYVWSGGDGSKYQRIMIWLMRAACDPMSQKTPLVICGDIPSGIHYATLFLMELFEEGDVDVISNHESESDEDRPIAIVDKPIREYLDCFTDRAYIIFVSDCEISDQDPRYLLAKCNMEEYTREYRRLLPLLCDEEEVCRFEEILRGLWRSLALKKQN